MPDVLASVEFGGKGPSGFSGEAVPFFVEGEGLAGLEEAWAALVLADGVPEPLDDEVCPGEICWAWRGMATASSHAPSQSHRCPGAISIQNFTSRRPLSPHQPFMRSS